MYRDLSRTITSYYKGATSGYGLKASLAALLIPLTEALLGRIRQ